MKVVLINDRLNAGGAEKMLVYIANLLHKNRIDVSVVLLLDKAALDNQIHPDIPIQYIKRTSRFSIKAFRKLKIYTQDADIVHVHSRYNLRYYMLAKFLFHIYKPKVFFHEHVPSFKIDFFTKVLFSKVDAYVAVQEQMKIWALNKKMVHKNRAFYLANTVDTPDLEILFNATPTYKIIMVGNFRPQKNHQFAITLLSQLPKKYTLDIYGMVDDAVYYDMIQQHIISLGQEKRVQLIRGVTNIYAQLGDYQFALHTSIAETGPLVLVEYLYAGLPFISYNTGDVVTFVNKCLPEFIVNSFNIDDWKLAIQHFEAIYDWSNIKNNMHELVNLHFSEVAYLTQLLNIYKGLLAE
jgi:glycosyltransferase involved in cell wall biosynthesis